MFDIITTWINAADYRKALVGLAGLLLLIYIFRGEEAQEKINRFWHVVIFLVVVWLGAVLIYNLGFK